MMAGQKLASLDQAGALFKVLTHPVRLAILQILRDGEECVCHMMAVLGRRQAYISQQLMVLRQAGLVTDRRDGWNVYYRVTRPEVFELLDHALQMTGCSRAVQESIFGLSLQAPACTCPKCQEKEAN